MNAGRNYNGPMVVEFTTIHFVDFCLSKTELYAGNDWKDLAVLRASGVTIRRVNQTISRKPSVKR